MYLTFKCDMCFGIHSQAKDKSSRHVYIYMKMTFDMTLVISKQVPLEIV